MRLSGKKRKRLKIAAIVMGVTLLTVVIASVFVDRYFQPLIKEKISQTVFEATDSLYKVSFSTLRFNVLNGNIQIKDIRLSPDTAVYERMKKMRTAPNNLYTVEVDRIEIKRLRSLQLYFSRKVKLSAIIVRNPSLKVVYERNRIEDDSSQNTRSVYDRIKTTVKSIAVGRIQMSGVDFRYVNLATRKPTISSFKNLALNAADILIDSLSQQRKGRFLFCKDINAELKDYRSNTPNKLYSYGFSLLQFSTGKQYVLVKGLSFTPAYPKVQFSKKLPVQKDRYVLRFDTLMLKGIDFRTLNNYQRLRATALRISQGSVGVFLNRNRPVPDVNKARNYPHMALKRLEFDVKIDTIQLNNIDIGYTEMSDQNQENGTLTFKDVGGEIFNVTNSPVFLAKNHVAKAALHTYLMGNGRLNVAMTFNLTDPKGAFSYKGTLGFMLLRSLNPVTKPLGMVEISSGSVNRIDFDMEGDTSGAHGRVTARYNNLNVKLLRQKEESERLIRRGLVSLFANALVIKSDNPTPGEPVRETLASYDRPRGASFFNVMWKTVFYGLKETVGITPDKENEISRRVDHLNDLKKRLESDPGKKEKRLVKKAERKRKRAERKALRKSEQNR